MKLLLVSLIALSFSVPPDFNLDSLVGNWYQVTGKGLVKDKNIFTIQKLDNEKYSGHFKIVESKKTIQYDLLITFEKEKKRWKLDATRDKQIYAWFSTVEDNTIYFTREFTENDEHYFSRQGYKITDNGELIRILEKSYDGTNFQGIEEKYAKE